ncbi:MAG TPA: HEAT repeat domain-containing protein [Candidatus Margulisiibacteriota bacterium]|nr:HEAT repeat domain-containing protein [Candidatus Margulisiibacteriota bacterium]
MTVAQRLRASTVDERLAAMTEVVARGAADADTLDALAGCLADPRKIIQRRAAETFAALGAHCAHVRAVLVRTIGSQVARQRWGAAYALSLLGDSPPVALPALFDALGSSDGDVRWAAGNILARLRGDNALVEALQRLLTAGNAAQRKMAAYCLRDLEARSPAGDRALLAALSDIDTYVRIAAISCIARLAMDRRAASRYLLNLLDDPNPSVRRVTAAALGLLGERSEAVQAALTAASHSPDASLARAAERSLRLLSTAQH